MCACEEELGGVSSHWQSFSLEKSGQGNEAGTLQCNYRISLEVTCIFGCNLFQLILDLRSKRHRTFMWGLQQLWGVLVLLPLHPNPAAQPWVWGVFGYLSSPF